MSRLPWRQLPARLHELLPKNYSSACGCARPSSAVCRRDAASSLGPTFVTSSACCPVGPSLGVLELSPAYWAIGGFRMAAPSKPPRYTKPGRPTDV